MCLPIRNAANQKARADVMLTAILSLTPLSGNLAIEGAIANMLAAQGDRILTVTCDGGQTRCILDNFYKPGLDRREACQTCHAGARSWWEQLGIRSDTPIDFDTLASPADLAPLMAAIEALDDEAVYHYRYEDLPLDEWLVDGLKLAYYGESWRRLPNLPVVAKQMLQGMVKAALAAHALIDRYRPDSILLLNGLIPNEHVIWEVSRRRGIHTVLYEGGQRPGTIFLSDRDPACAYEVSEAWHEWRHVPLSYSEAQAMDTVLVKRMYQGAGGYVYSPTASGTGVRTQMALAETAPLFVAFTNSSADTSVFRSNRLFSQQITWIDGLIRHAAERPEMALVIRIHPVEGSTGTFREGRIVGVRDKIADGIVERWPQLPANVRVVDSLDSVSSYDLMQQAQVVLAYVSTVGIEATMLGKPVVNAGTYHYTHKGFTYCPETPEAYFDLLDRLLADPQQPPHATELARRYMYLWLYRGMPDVPSLRVEPANQQTDLRLEPISNYGRGRCRSYDRIVDYLRHRRPFIDPPADWRPRDAGNPAPLPPPVRRLVLGSPDWERLDDFARQLLTLPVDTTVTLLSGPLSPEAAAERLIRTLMTLAPPTAWPELDTVSQDLPNAALASLLMQALAVLTGRRMPHTDRLATMADHAGVPLIAAHDVTALSQLAQRLHAPAVTPQPA